MSTKEPRVHKLDNGIIVTIKPLFTNMSTFVLSGTWKQCLHIGHTRTDEWSVHGWEGLYGFRAFGKLSKDYTTFTTSILNKEVERDLRLLARLEIVNPDADDEEAAYCARSDSLRDLLAPQPPAGEPVSSTASSLTGSPAKLVVSEEERYWTASKFGL